MTRNKVYAIIEGHGEVGMLTNAKEQSAVVHLIRKLLRELQCDMLFPASHVPPFRLGSYGSFFRDNKLERAIRFHKKYPDCSAVLVLLDMDDDCPKKRAIELVNRIQAMEVLPFSVTVVCARREYESWFLASLETICGQNYPGDPETRRDAKGWLRKEFEYKPTLQQAAYTQKLDINLAKTRSRSFRRLYHAVEEIVHAMENNQPVITPIPKGR